MPYRKWRQRLAVGEQRRKSYFCEKSFVFCSQDLAKEIEGCVNGGKSLGLNCEDLAVIKRSPLSLFCTARETMVRPPGGSDQISMKINKINNKIKLFLSGKYKNKSVTFTSVQILASVRGSFVASFSHRNPGT